ncbi:MAG: fasciclin domain-containing protein [Planctomycetota bacterium]|jgi:uncharacterized surface protein with fasciclin (FAS1) repeats
MKTYSKTILTNGLIILLGVLTVPGFAGPKGDSIVDVAIQLNSDGPFAGQFDTLIAAVLAASPIVLETLDGNGKFTVFAPTDDAFAEIDLDPNSVAELDQAFLTDVLLYHVSHGNRKAKVIQRQKRIRVLKGGFVYSEGWVLIDNLGREVDLIAFDVKAANGVIHAINRVLLPKAP